MMVYNILNGQHNPGGMKMYSNKYSVRVVGAQEIENGYVSVTHGQIYTLMLRNDHDTRCDAKVFIDGKEIGTFRIKAKGSFEITRPSSDSGCFTFFEMGTSEFSQGGIATNQDLGLISVRFTPEKKQQTAFAIQKEPNVFFSGPTRRSAMASNHIAGGTALTGESSQSYTNADRLILDYASAHTINLRLVAEAKAEAIEIRPLVSATPVPPAVH